MDHRQRIQHSIDYIEENLTAPITAAELAEQAGFSLYHYYRLFQTATGMPVMQYILRRRLLHGIYEIRRGSSGIDAALRYGFDTYAGFYRAFRREFGCTPSAFLRGRRAKRPCRLDLYQEEHMTVTKKKASQLLKNWGLENETISDIYYDGSGSKNDNAFYVGDGYVLKFTANSGKLKTNISLSKAAQRVGLWAATPVLTTGGQEFIQDGELYYCLTRRLPGRQISAAGLYEGDCAANGRFVGEIIGQLHLALDQVEACVSDADLLTALRNWALPKAQAVLGLPQPFCREYLDSLTTLYPALPRQIIHRDPNPGNIICAEKQWGFIDFELSERNARIYDPCYAATAVLSETSGADREKWLEIYRNILLGYASVVKLTDAERRAAPYIVLANQLVCVAWFSGEEKYAELLEINKQMTRWLMENFDRPKLDA